MFYTKTEYSSCSTIFIFFFVHSSEVTAIIAASTHKIGPVQRMIMFGTVIRGTVMWLNVLVAE
jgi:hypothetical protein